jgi:CRISPR-associated exonuclease Cas4
MLQERLSRLCERLDELDLHGLDVWHASICRRRAWNHLHGVNYANQDQTVALGSALHEAAYSRDRSVEGLLGMAPDRIDWSGHIVHEHKKGDHYPRANDRQLGVYVALLAHATGQAWIGHLTVLGRKRPRQVELDEALLGELESMVDRLEELKGAPPPAAERIEACRRCAHAAACWEDG